MKTGKRHFSIGDFFRTLVLIVALCVFTYSAYRVTKIMLEYNEGDTEYANIESMFIMNQPDETDKQGKTKKTAVKEDEQDKKWVFDFDKLLAINQDAKGYIRQDGTLISYPVLQGTNNSYYLYHTFDHTYNRNGSIFIDSQIEKGFDAKNCIIYGHNMWTDTMFGTLTKYTDQAYYKAHPEFDIYAGKKHYKYHVFASFQADASGDSVYTYEFGDEDTFLKWAQEQRSRSYLGTSDVREIKKDDHVITLSTCTTRGDENKRVIVLLVREKEVK